ncbi:hypothetical protein ACMHYB_28675 [Sorangium sp. So ce1128]
MSISRSPDRRHDKVVPEMAALLELPRYDPIAGTGEFSCHYCHTMEGAEEE